MDLSGIESVFSGSVETINEVSGVFIHPTAQVSKGAELGTNVVIGPGAMIGSQVKLGDGVQVGVGAVISRRTAVGARTKVYPYATVGSIPQDLKYKGEDSEVIVGADNVIREYVNISLGTEGGGGKTVIGDGNLIMVYTHLGHDCIIGNRCILANGVQLAGHVEAGDGVIFGGLSAAHQFTRIGNLAMIAAGSMVSQDVPPFCMVHGDRAKVNGLNVVGLRRAKMKNISDVKTMFKIIYNSGLRLTDAIAMLRENVDESAERNLVISFLEKSERGICR